MGRLDLFRKAMSGLSAFSTPSLSSVLMPLGPSAIEAPISLSSLAFSYTCTSTPGWFLSAMAAPRPAIPAPMMAIWILGGSAMA